MGTGKGIETRGHLVGFKEEIDKIAKEDKDSFFTWFDSAENTNVAFIRGQWDFMFHIARPLARYISKPEKKIALEIGYGGGRILAAATCSFKKVIGVDIHNHKDLVAKELTNRGYSNFELKQGDGKSLSMSKSSIDVVYSFIVFQHIEKVEYFERYLKEVFRIVKKGGIAILYFGRFAHFSVGKKLNILYLLDKYIEPFFLRKGFIELPSAVNDINLLISMKYAKKISRHIGFEVLDTLVSKKKVPDGCHYYGLQHAIILKRP